MEREGGRDGSRREGETSERLTVGAETTACAIERLTRQPWPRKHERGASSWRRRAEGDGEEGSGVDPDKVNSLEGSGARQK